MTPEKNIKIENNVNKINSKIAKNVFRVGLATSMLLGAPGCVATQNILTTPTPEISPLPADSTKAPTLSPTEAPIELTPVITNPATQELTLVPPTEVATEIPVVTLAPEPTATATEVPTVIPTLEPTAMPTEIPTPVPVDELGIRLEIPLGQGMTREELKSSVEWYYNLSDSELNQKIEGNLWSSNRFPDDSRPRDDDTSVPLRDFEDLGWYLTKVANSQIAIKEWSYINTIYLGTTVDRGEGLSPLYISAFGTKDWLGNRFVIYTDTGLYRYDDCGDFQISTTSKRIQDVNMIKPIFNPKEGNYELLNNYRGDVVGLVLQDYLKFFITKEQMTKCGPIFTQFQGSREIIDLIKQQIKGLSTTSAKDLVDSSLDVKFNKLPNKLSLDNLKNLAWGMMSLPKN